MSHLDEGTLHALLDGELELAEISEIQLHLGACAACGSRLQEVKQVLAEADRLVGSIDVPAYAPRSRSEPARSTPPLSTPPPQPPLPPLAPAWDEPPVLLVPDAPADEARRRWIRGLKWAAALVIVVGGGRLLSSALGPSHPVLPERDLSSATPSVPPAVVSQAELRAAESVVTQNRSSRLAPRDRAAAAKTAARRPAPVADSPVARSEDGEESAGTPLADTAVEETRLLAAAGDTTGAAEDESAREPVTDSVARVDSEVEDTPDFPTTEEERVATRRAAAEALAELDRQRLRERANAATAALPPSRAEPQPAESVPPAPRTLQQRAQIYLPIGLDEAFRQLGSPLHVIQGMSPELVGLVQGRLVPGADPARPVVRVVYLDSRERMILLDQQRMRTGQAPGSSAGNLRWTVGDVMLYLRGEPPAEVLRNLQRRVR
jgi:hypothetical protein